MRLVAVRIFPARKSSLAPSASLGGKGCSEAANGTVRSLVPPDFQRVRTVSCRQAFTAGVNELPVPANNLFRHRARFTSGARFGAVLHLSFKMDKLQANYCVLYIYGDKFRYKTAEL